MARKNKPFNSRHHQRPRNRADISSQHQDQTSRHGHAERRSSHDANASAPLKNLDPEVSQFLQELHRSLTVKEKGKLETLTTHASSAHQKRKSGLLRLLGLSRARPEVPAARTSVPVEIGQDTSPVVAAPPSVLAEEPVSPAAAPAAVKSHKNRSVSVPVAQEPTMASDSALAEAIQTEVEASIPSAPVKRASLFGGLLSRLSPRIPRAVAPTAVPSLPKPGLFAHFFAKKQKNETPTPVTQNDLAVGAPPNLESNFIVLSSTDQAPPEPASSNAPTFSSDVDKETLEDDMPIGTTPAASAPMPSRGDAPLANAPLVPASALVRTQAPPAPSAGMFGRLRSLLHRSHSSVAASDSQTEANGPAMSMTSNLTPVAQPKTTEPMSANEQTVPSQEAPKFFDADSPFAANKTPEGIEKRGFMQRLFRKKSAVQQELSTPATSNLTRVRSIEKKESQPAASRQSAASARSALHKYLPTLFPGKKSASTGAADADIADDELSMELLRQLKTRSARMRLHSFLNSNFPTFFPSGQAPQQQTASAGSRSAFAQEPGQIVMTSELPQPQADQGTAEQSAAGTDAPAESPGKILSTSSHLESIRNPTALEEVMDEQKAAMQAMQQPTSNLRKASTEVKAPVAPESQKITQNVKKRLDILHVKEGGLRDLMGAIKFLGLGKERTNLIQNLSTMLNAGLTLIDALHTLQRETRPRPLKKMLQNVVEAVESGSALWRALQAQHFFSPQAISLIRIGEEAGNLAQNMEHLADQEEKDNDLKGKIKMAMIYPAIVIVLMFIIVMGLGLFVLPNLIGVLFSLNVKLPLVTRLLVAFTNGFTQYAAIVVPGTIGGAILIVILAKFTPLKVVFQWMEFRVPGIGRLAREATIARFGVILGSLLEAGVPLIEAVNSLAEVTPIVAYRNFYFRLLEHLNQGDSFGKSFELIHGSNGLLPISVQQLVMTGEKSGSLSKIMLKIADIYQKKANDTAQKLPVILEPMLLLFIGGLVGTIAIAIIVPIYSVVGSVGKT